MISKTRKKIIKERIEQLESDQAYNDAEGVHTYSPCKSCEKGTRTGYCSECIKKMIELLNKELKQK